MADTETDNAAALPATPPRRPFQFRLWHLLLAPVAVGLFFGVAAQEGVPVALFTAGLLVSLAGLAWRRTRAPAALGTALCLLLLLLVPAVRNARSAALRANCNGHLKQIVLALHFYHDVHGCFPPAAIRDAQGRPRHSWRVLLLPYLEQQALYQQYRFDEPWDGPHNRRLAGQMPAVYRCPQAEADDEGRPSEHTSYLALVGPHGPWPDEGSRTLAEMTDGPGNCLLVVESAEAGIPWMDPRDLHLLQMAPAVNPAAGQGISSPHGGGAYAGMADGLIRWLTESLTPAEFRSLTTIDGGEPPVP